MAISLLVIGLSYMSYWCLSEVCEHAILPNKNQTIKLTQRENTFKSALFYDKRKKIELGFIIFLF